MRWLPFTPQEDSWYSFMLEAESTSGLEQLEGLGQLKNPVALSAFEPTSFWLVA
jgi:hypothetical protein